MGRSLENRMKMHEINSVVYNYKINELSNATIKFVTKEVGLNGDFLKRDKSAVKSAIDKAIKLQWVQNIKEHRAKFTPFDNKNENFWISELVRFFDSAIFSDKMNGLIKVIIKEKMREKAGESVYENGKCDLFLSQYYITDFDRLTSIVMHEMCHCAQWIIDNDAAVDHAAHNQNWENAIKYFRNFHQ
jgi:hypothetical protein